MRVTAFLAMVCAFALGGKAMAEELKVGDKAPNFELQASDGKTYKLSDFAGKQAVVLAWFPAAFTQGCTIECKSLAENGDKIRMYDVAYFMASVDDPETNKKFAEQEMANFPMLSDPDRKVGTAYGVVTSPTGVAKRWTFYIGPDGKILYIEKNVKTETAGADLAAKLAELNVKKK